VEGTRREFDIPFVFRDMLAGREGGGIRLSFVVPLY
jgi:hypothetical protein